MTSRIAVLLLALATTLQARQVKLYVLHVNDVYEIQGVAAGSIGGMARVARVAHELRDRYGRQSVITVVSGDVFSPSGVGTVLRNGGAHMVEVMNVDAGGAPAIEYAVLGNHEFDIKAAQFDANLQAPAPRWFSANVTLAAPYTSTLPDTIEVTRTINGVRVPIVFTGVTIDSNQPPGVTYSDALETLRSHVDALKDKAAIVLAMTHIARADDVLAARTKGIDIILGGHDHQASFDDPNGRCRGDMTTPIVCTPTSDASAAVFKADSNARTYWVHQLTWDSNTKRVVRIESRLHELRGPIGPRAGKVVNATMARLAETKDLKEAFGGRGLSDTIAVASEDLDGREPCARGIKCEDRGRLNRLVARALACANEETQQADLVMFNGGLIRIDDVIPKGSAITPMDILRISPFGNKAMAYAIQGDKLAAAIALSHERCVDAAGCFLQVTKPASLAIDPQKTYTVAMPDFLLGGREQIIGPMLKDEEAAAKPGPDLRASLVGVLTNQPCRAKALAD